MRQERLELSILSALASRTSVYTIPPLTHKCLSTHRSKRINIYGRSTRIRTLDPLLPKQMRYRAALHSECLVPSDGIEPSRRKAADFESAVSTYSTTKAYLSIIYNCNVDVYSKMKKHRLILAEAVGFEPTGPFKIRWFSRPVQ